MNTSKAHSLLTILSLLAGSTAHGVTFNWVEDSFSAFDVKISGTGTAGLMPNGTTFVGWDGAITSPTGKWNLSTYNECTYPLPNGQPLMGVSNGGIMTFLGQLPNNLLPNQKQPIIDPNLQTVGYVDSFPVGAAHDENAWDNGFLVDAGWHGMTTFDITSTPNPNDPKTWTWVADYEASGPGLMRSDVHTLARTPDSSAWGKLDLIALGFVGGFALWRKSQEAVTQALPS